MRLSDALSQLSLEQSLFRQCAVRVQRIRNSLARKVLRYFPELKFNSQRINIVIAIICAVRELNAALLVIACS